MQHAESIALLLDTALQLDRLAEWQEMLGDRLPDGVQADAHFRVSVDYTRRADAHRTAAAVLTNAADAATTGVSR